MSYFTVHAYLLLEVKTIEMKTILLTEKQLKSITQHINEDTCYQMPNPQSPSAKKANFPYSINPEKVKIVQKFLDNNYKKATFCRVGANGMPETIKIVGLLDKSSGNVLQNMRLDDLEDQLITQFQNMFSDKIERQAFLNRVVNDWFDDKITPLGLLSVNHL
jgi:hypothetical protein